MAKNYLEDREGYIKNCQNNKSTENPVRIKNRAYGNLVKWYKAFELNKTEAENFLRPLIENPDDNYSVACWASAHALGLGILTKEAINLLEEILEKWKNNELKTLEARWNHISAEALLEQYHNGEKIRFY